MLRAFLLVLSAVATVCDTRAGSVLGEQERWKEMEDDGESFPHEPCCGVWKPPLPTREGGRGRPVCDVMRDLFHISSDGHVSIM